MKAQNPNAAPASPGWHLAAEWSLGLPGAASVESIALLEMEAVRSLGLPPEQLDRLGQDLARMVQTASGREALSGPVQTLFFRLYVSQQVEKRLHRGKDPPVEIPYPQGRSRGSSWGYFLSERTLHLQGAHLIEVYLYREGR